MVEPTLPTPQEPLDDKGEAGDASTPPVDGTEPADTPVTHEVTLRDGESVTFSAPADGTAHIVVNVVQPPRPTSFFGSCLEGCGCLFVIGLIIAFISAGFR